MRGKSVPRSRRKRLLVAGLLCPLAGTALAGGWAAHLGLSVHDHLRAAADALAQVRAAGPEGAGPALATAREHAEQAHRITSGLTWTLAAHTPFVGTAATTVRGLADFASQVTGVLTDVHRAGAPLLAVRRPSAGDLGGLLTHLESAAPALHDAAGRMDAARAGLAATPSGTGLAPLDQARDTALREADRLSGWLGAADDAAALLPDMLGGHGPRRYFLAFQTNAESRGTGGLVGAFGLLKAAGGRVDVERLSPNNGLASGTAQVIDHGSAFRARYGASALSLLANSNLSPHFPYAAATWAALWERQTHEQLDGAVATDPVGLSYLLRLIGPVTLPGGETVSAANVVDLTERAAYARYQNPVERKRYLIGIASAVSEALTRARPEPGALLSVLTRLVEERRIQVWSRREDEQRRLAATPLGGVLPDTPGPYAGLIVNNSAGTKLDYYLDRSLEYHLGPCRTGGQRLAYVRVRLTNGVPPVRLPTYVTDRLDDPGGSHPTGSNLLWVSYYATPGAQLAGARLDGEPEPVIKEVERSHPVYSKVIELAPRQTRTLEFMLLEPASAAQPQTPVQPLVRGQQTRITRDDTGCPFALPQADR